MFVRRYNLQTIPKLFISIFCTVQFRTKVLSMQQNTIKKTCNVPTFLLLERGLHGGRGRWILEQVDLRQAPRINVLLNFNIKKQVLMYIKCIGIYLLKNADQTPGLRDKNMTKHIFLNKVYLNFSVYKLLVILEQKS